MKSLKIALGCACLLAAPAAFGQAAPVQPATPATGVVIGGASENVLRAGTPVALKMSEPLTTDGKKLRAGQRFMLEVAEPVTIGGRIVIPAGSPATGEVTEVRNKGMWGKSGRIAARILFVRANGRQIRLTGQVDDKGTTGTAGVVASAVLIPVVGFFVTGTSANIPLGAPVSAFVDEDLPVAFADASPAPMTVPARAATPQP